MRILTITIAALLAAAVLVASDALGHASFARPAALAQQAPSPEQQGQKVIDKGLEFLKSRQQPNGSWQATDRVPPAITALALRGFVNDSRYGPDHPIVKSGFDALIAQQVADGGIYEDLLANYNTAIAVSALAEARQKAGDDRYTEVIDKAVQFLKKLQWTEETDPQSPEDKPGEEQSVSGPQDPFYGGWGYGGRSRGPGRPDLSNAHIALEALSAAGVPKEDAAYSQALIFVGRLQNYSQANSAEWAGDDGGFIYSPGGDRNFESFAGEYVTAAGQRRLRSYGSMTYAGLKSMVYAGLSKDDPRVRAAFDWIQNNWTLEENPGIAADNPENKDHGLYYYYLTLARALNAYDQPVLLTPQGPVDWRVAFIEGMSQLQRPDGSFSGNERWLENDPVLVTSYVVIALENALEDLRQHPVRR